MYRREQVDSLHEQQGFGLIESIATLLIVSFGLLTLAYMQSWGQRYGQDSGARTQATMIATELMDRIRATGIPAVSGDTAGYTTTPTGAITCTSTTASVANDVNCFFLQIRDRLPTGAGAISTNGNMYQITIAWLDRFADTYDTGGDGLSKTECENNNRLWSNDSSINWYPSSSKPSEASCLLVQRWSLMQ